jgi:MFS family permease
MVELAKGSKLTSASTMLALLFVAYNLSILDRTIINLLVDPIKSTLGISDTQFSLLQGVAFLIVYSVIGLPMGYLADRTNRIRLVACGITFWSAMTAFCGLATAYWLLFLGRIGVGIGEATLSPTSYSLIASSFPKRRLGLALGLYSIGGTTGAGIALIAGGYVVHGISRLGQVTVPILGAVAGWQLTFFAVALPGLVVATLIYLIPEPMRHTAAETSAERSDSRRKAARFFRSNKCVLACHHLAVGITNMTLYGTVAWIAPFFSRVHGWPIDRIGLVTGVTNIVAGIVGLLGGGVLGDYLLRYGPSMRLVLCVAVIPVGALAGLAFPLISNPLAAAVLFGIVLSASILPFGAAGAALQMIVPSGARGLSAAVFLLVVSLVTALGPTLIAAMNDHLFLGHAGIRYSLSTFIPLSLLASCLCFLATIRPYSKLAAAVDVQ